MDKKQIKVISFDLDNTIWDNQPVIIKALQAERKILEENFPKASSHLQENPKLIQKLRKRVLEEHPDRNHDFNFIRKTSLKYLGERLAYSEAKIEELVHSCFSAFDSTRHEVEDHIYPGTLKVLKYLKSKGFVLLALTNGTADTDRIENLKELFHHHISAFKAGALKPHHAPFQKLLEVTNASREEILHVGDNIIDDVTGSALYGIRVVWVSEQLSSVQLGPHHHEHVDKNLSDKYHVASVPSVASIPDILSSLGFDLTSL